MTPNPSPMHTGKPGLSTLLVKSGVQNRWELQFRILGYNCRVSPESPLFEPKNS